MRFWRLGGRPLDINIFLMPNVGVIYCKRIFLSLVLLGDSPVVILHVFSKFWPFFSFSPLARVFRLRNIISSYCFVPLKQFIHDSIILESFSSILLAFYFLFHFFNRAAKLVRRRFPSLERFGATGELSCSDCERQTTKSMSNNVSLEKKTIATNQINGCYNCCVLKVVATSGNANFRCELFILLGNLSPVFSIWQFGALIEITSDRNRSF